MRRLARLLGGAALHRPHAALARASGSGPATSVNQQSTPPTSGADAYTGPAPANADVQAFKINLWQNIRPAEPLRRLSPRGRPVAACSRAPMT